MHKSKRIAISHRESERTNSASTASQRDIVEEVAVGHTWESRANWVLEKKEFAVEEREREREREGEGRENVGRRLDEIYMVREGGAHYAL